MMPPGAENRQNIKESDAQCGGNRMLHPDQGQADRKLKKGDAHNQGVGADADQKGPDQIFPDVQQQGAAPFRKLAQDESGQRVVILGEKKGRDDHQEQLDKESRQRGGPARNRGNRSHRDGRNRTAQRLNRLREDLVYRLSRRGVHPGKESLKPGGEGKKRRLDLVGIKAGKSGDQLLAERDELDAEQRNEQPDGRVEGQHHEDGTRTLF